MKKRLFVYFLCALMFPLFCCKKSASDTRKPAVASQFYSADAGELKSGVITYLSKVPEQKIPGTPIAFLVPHAGYMYSAQTAAYSYSVLSGMDVTNIVLIGNSHHYPLSKAAVYPSGKFDTPIGAVEINETLARKIISESALFEENRTPHIPEHSLEVQLPFLLMTLKNFKIVPILTGNYNFSLDDCKRAGEAVAKAIKELGLEHGGCQTYHFIASAVSVNVVEGLEVVQVEEEHGRHMSRPAGVSDCLV